MQRFKLGQREFSDFQRKCTDCGKFALNKTMKHGLKTHRCVDCDNVYHETVIERRKVLNEVASMKKKNLQGLSLILIVLSLFFISCGCEHEESETSFIDRGNDLKDTAVNECQKRGQDYLLHFTDNLVDWKVVCYHKSPFREFRYGIE